MFTIHCTTKVLTSLKVKPAPPITPTTRLGNWYANHLAGPRSPIICISERTYLPVVVARCPAAKLPRALADALALLLTGLGIPKALIDEEHAAMLQASWAKTESRMLLGVLNEQAKLANFARADGVSDVNERTREVADNMVKLQRPTELTYAAFGLDPENPPVPGEGAQGELDVAALKLPPLELRDEGEWDPADHEWGEAGEDLPSWAKAVLARGPRQAFEMEQVLPGGDPNDSDWDPIPDAVELRERGLRRQSTALLQGLLVLDLRCLDAHAHLGNAEFDDRPDRAFRHYRVGVTIGDQALGPDFDGVLPWGLIDNRPYLRCLHGLGLCHWRLGRLKEAAAVFTRMLWLNPNDNQGVRFLLNDLENGRPWQP